MQFGIEINSMDNLLHIANLQNLLGNHRQMRICDEKYGDFFLRAEEGDKDLLPDFIAEYQIIDGFLNLTIENSALMDDVAIIVQNNLRLGVQRDKNTIFKSRLYFNLDKDTLTTPLAHRLAVYIVDLYRLYKLGYQYDNRILDVFESYDK